MSKLSFRTRVLDPSKPIPIYLAEELPDLPEYSAINRAVPQMPSGMEKEEESEHHLQRAICTGLIIPTPEVFETEREFYERNYPPTYKMPRQMIHMQPLNLEQDIPDYDMDSADELWVNSQSKRLDLTWLKFEQMMDRLEKSSGQTVVTLNEAKALLKQDDEVSIAVYDYWLNKRLKTQHPLILTVKTENRGGIAANSPYLAFRRRTEKMQTRKNRKNDETSYEKMLKLRRDLSRAVTLLEMIKKREKTKREQLHLGVEIFEKRYAARDFNGQLLAEFTSQAAKTTTRPAFAPIYSNQYSMASPQSSQWSASANANHFSGQYSGVAASGANKRDVEAVNGAISTSRKEKRQYKKRKHKQSQRDKRGLFSSPGPTVESMVSSEDDDLSCNLQASESEDEGMFMFRRNKNCQYNRPLRNGYGNWPWTSKEENGSADPRYRFTLTSIGHPRPRCIGFARRRMGRGGRVILDRVSTNMDELWSRLDYKIFDSGRPKVEYDSQTKRLLDLNLELSDSLNRNHNNSYYNSNNATTTNNNIMDSLSGSLSNHVNASGRLEEVELDDQQQEQQQSERTLVADLLLRQESNVIKSEHNNNISNSDSSNNLILNTTSSLLMDKLNKVGDGDDSSSGIGGILSSSSNLVNSNGAEVISESSVDLAKGFNQDLILTSLNRSVSVPSNLLLEATTAAAVVKSEPTNGVDLNEIDSISIDNEEDMSIADLVRTKRQANKHRTAEEFMDSVRREWLHFKPQVTKLKENSDNEEENERIKSAIEDLPKFSETTQLDLELSTIGDELPSSIFMNSEDSLLYHPQPFALNDLMDFAASPVSQVSTPSISPNITKIENSTNELSGDSLNELSLNLGDAIEENDKMLENILEECQMDDLKILEDPALFTGLEPQEESKSIFDKAFGYQCEFSSWSSKRPESDLKLDKRGKLHLVQRVTGCSQFHLSRSIAKEETFTKTDPNETIGQGLEGETSTEEEIIAIKQEPIECPMENSGNVIQLQTIKVEKQEDDLATTLDGATIIQSNATTISTPNIIFRPQDINYLTRQDNNTIILTSNINAVKNHHLNGPIDKAITPTKSAVLLNRKLPGQKLNEGDLIIGTSGIISNSGTSNSSALNNHNYSTFGTANSIPKPISIIGTTTGGQIQASGNKFYINTTSLVNQQQQLATSASGTIITNSSQTQQKPIQEFLAAAAASGQNKLQWSTIGSQNLKFNLMTTGNSTGNNPNSHQTATTADLKNILATSIQPNLIINDHGVNSKGNQVAASSSGQTIIQANAQQRQKTMNVFLNSEKRFLYANNQGQIVAQINPKMVNIVPVQQAQQQHQQIQNVIQRQQQLNSTGGAQTGEIRTINRILIQRQDATTAGPGSAAVSGATAGDSTAQTTSSSNNSQSINLNTINR